MNPKEIYQETLLDENTSQAAKSVVSLNEEIFL